MKHRPWRKSSYQSSSLIAAVLLVMIVFISVAYFFLLTPADESEAREAELTRLQQHRMLWAERRPPAYRFVVQSSSGTNSVTEDHDIAPETSWIDTYFSSIEEAILLHEEVTVRYDSRFGYPNDVILDGEQTYIRDFEVLRYPD